MQSHPDVDPWLAALTQAEPARGQALTRLVQGARAHLPAGFQEVLSATGPGMPSWVVPLSTFPDGYHCTPGEPLPFLAVANQKRHIAVYHMGIYSDPELLAWFQQAYAAQVPTKLNMGKSCIRFGNPKKIPFDLIDELFTKMTPAAWVERYQAAR